jgi:chloramphenicol O-acetyltransferase type A
MGHYLDLDNWPRRGHFAFFLGYEQPFFQLCAEIEVTQTAQACAQGPASFALACWYACLRAINAVEPFRYRLRGDRVWVHDQIHASTTVLRPDETFGFCHLPLAEDFATFSREGAAAIAASRATTGLTMEGQQRDDLIYGSMVPWLRITSVSNARRHMVGDSVPRVVMGRKTHHADGSVTLPVSVEAHHALLDGLHVARLLDHMQHLLTHPEGWMQ